MSRARAPQSTTPRPCIKCGGTDRTKRGDCKDCAKLIKKNWYKDHKRVVAAYKKEWLSKHPDKSKEFDLRVRVKRYGLTINEFQGMLNQQDGCCAICCGVLESIDIDHDHETKVVRGLLCHSCNIGLGAFQDDPAILSRAIQYLIQSRTKELFEPVEAIVCTST